MSHYKGGSAVLLVVIASVSGNVDASGNGLKEAALAVSLLLPVMKIMAISSDCTSDSKAIATGDSLYAWKSNAVFRYPVWYQVSPDQAQLLAMLVQILGAERCIEVGVYTGYSSLAIALVLPESGHLVACERDCKSLDVAKKYYQLAGVSHKVEVKLGLAMDSLESLIQNGEAGRSSSTFLWLSSNEKNLALPYPQVSFCGVLAALGFKPNGSLCYSMIPSWSVVIGYDFAFIDAEKRMNEKYFELLLQLVRVGGLIVIDNVLWHGKVADPLVYDPKTISIRNFNQKLMEDERVSISMVPIGDGMTICRKS
ncbi:unnamed protein product [Sphenostylis stenocarpa]|uniref:Caffeoyl-CoA O-methyltransferase n=1 Tax=Sphenostylis stenocarpa TaxID=92480 RepID=A0AA86SK91_9FABA|nr:unnamed protein product [Sphenostylis stenocarpa]